MAQRTSIFISSAAQSELVPVREGLAKYLKQLGHIPMRYEDDFSPWDTYVDNIKHCLDMVRKADLFILLIYNSAGSSTRDLRTVTHLEFLTAYDTRKEIIVFVEKQIKDFYFKNVHAHLQTAITMYQRDQDGRFPFNMLELVSSIPGKLEHVNDYIWVFLYDLVSKGIYIEEMKQIDKKNGRFDITGINRKITEILSDILRYGAAMKPIEDLIIQNSKLAETYIAYQEMAEETLKLLTGTEVTDWRAFLSLLRENLKGGEILEDGEFRKQYVNSLKDCSGITLYVRQGDLMVLVERDGRAKGKEFYHLEEVESFVVKAYKAGELDTLSLDETKNMLYFTSHIEEFVLSIHFKVNDRWNVRDLELYKKEVFHGIMKQNQAFIGLAKLVLGGIQYETQ